MTKLTAKETALMTQIAKGQFSYFDEGLVAGSGIWSEALTDEANKEVSATPKGAATVMSSLCRKGLLFSDKGSYTEGEGAWVELTEAGEAWITEFNGESYEETVARIEAEREAAKAAPAEVVLDTPAFRITEWTEDGGDEWLYTNFADGSFTARRRRKVNGAWRTDFWGTTAEGKKVYTTSKASKAAREAGRFTI